MSPLIIPGRFSEYYQMLAREQSAMSCSELVSNTDSTFLFSLIAHDVSISDVQWRGVLMRLGISVPPNFAHAYDIHREIIALIQRGELRLVKIARLENLPVFTTGDGWGFCFIRGPQPHPSTSYSPVVISSLVDAQMFFNSLNVGEEEFWLFAHHNPAIALLLEQKGDFLQRFIEGLANRSILAYKMPVHSAAPPVKALEFVAATAIDREVPLAPEAGPAPAIVSSILSERKGVPPKSLDDAGNRLHSMKQEINDNGYQPKYSDEELLQQAQAGLVAQERYHVRFMEVGHQWDRFDTVRDPNNLTGKLGREFTGETGTGPRYWSTTFDQIEDADTDAELICQKLGIGFKKGTEYALVIIDTDVAKPLTGCECVAATFDNISAFANRELPKKFPKEFTDEVMNPEFQASYKVHHEAAQKGFINGEWSTDTKGFSDYLSTKKLSDAEKKALVKRMDMHDKIGNNQHYLGNGVTEDKIPKSKNKCGAVETHNFERAPTNLQKLKDNGAIKIITL